MQYLDSFSAVINAFGGQAALKKRVDAAGARPKTALLDAVKALHPEHVFKIPDKQSAASARKPRRLNSLRRILPNRRDC